MSVDHIAGLAVRRVGLMLAVAVLCTACASSGKKSSAKTAARPAASAKAPAAVPAKPAAGAPRAAAPTAAKKPATATPAAAKTKPAAPAAAGKAAPAAGKAAPATPARPAAAPARKPPPAVVRPVLSPTVDVDRDRIIDTADLCPGTPAGFRVDDRGCMVSQGFFLSDAYFEPESAVLSKPARQTLDRLAIALKVQKEAVVDIAGATAGTGTPLFRGQLAEQRRESLRQHMIKRGVIERRVTVMADPAKLPPRRGVRLKLIVQ